MSARISATRTPFDSVATKNLPNYLGWRRALEAWSDQVIPRWINRAIGNGPTAIAMSPGGHLSNLKINKLIDFSEKRFRIY